MKMNERRRITVNSFETVPIIPELNRGVNRVHNSTESSKIAVMDASVIVPAYNAGQTIEHCLAALLAQSFPREQYEIIVVDDGSTDETPAIVARMPEVRLIRGEHRGAAAARNLGAQHARGNILLFTDADCEPLPDWIAQMLTPFADTTIAGAKGVYRTQQREWIARFVQLEYVEKYARMARERFIDFIDTYSAAYRREVFLHHKGFDEAFPGASVEDQEFSFRLARQGYRMVFAPQAVVYHRHVTSLGAYAKRKFWIGYWKVRVHTRHPGKVWRDAHTPPTLKIQVVLCAAFIVLLTIGIFLPVAWLAATIIAGLFLITTLPLLALIARRDPVIVLIAPLMIVVRAAALGIGLVAGIVGEIGRRR